MTAKAAFALFMFCFPALATASCLDEMQRIHSDINRYKGKLPDQKIIWADPVWLKKHFIAGPEAAIQKQLYQWAHFSYFQGEDGAVSIVGPLPKGLTTQSSLKDIKRLSGPPIQSQTETLYRTEWRCEQDNSLSTLGLVKDGKGKLISVRGQMCEGQSCESFITTFSKGTLERAFIQKATVAMGKDEKRIMEYSIENYNRHFSTKLLTEAELNEQATHQVEDYYSHLRQCTPGTYVYAMYAVMIGHVFPVSVIEGQQKGLCEVVTTYNMPGVGKVTSRCHFSQKSLKLFSDQEARVRALGILSYDADQLTPVQAAFNSECELAIDERTDVPMDVLPKKAVAEKTVPKKVGPQKVPQFVAVAKHPPADRLSLGKALNSSKTNSAPAHPAEHKTLSKISKKTLHPQTT